MNFVANLHCHADSSQHDGFAIITELPKRAKELGYEALALTDHGTVSGLFQFYQACKKEGIKPLLGCEMYFVHDINLKESTMYHMLFLAKDLDGYKNLMRLNKFAHENFYKKPRINMAAIDEFHEGLICTTACLAGILRQDDPLEDMHELSFIFGRDLYVEVQPHDMDDQKAYNWKAYEFAKAHGHKVIVTLDSHYVRKEDAPYHRLWLNLGDESDYYPTQTYYLMSTEEVDDYMMNFHGFSREDVDSFYANIKEIVDKCNVEIPVGGQHYPNFCADPEAYIRKRCNEGYMEKKVGKWPNKKEHIDRINYEIDMLGKTGYWNYMCIIDDMMHHCKKVGIRTGLGRGSVVGSDVAYFMGITKVDPLKYNLLFERFCNPERVTSPDVDVDVQTSRRDELIEYIKSRYGEVFQVRTFGYIKPKSACRRACESLGYEPARTNELCKNIVDVDDLQDKKAREIAKHFMGHIINYSTHASAVIVCPDEITNYTSIERQKSAKTGEYDYVVCYEFHDCEAMGLLKLDILGLQHLDVIDRVVKQVGVDYDSIPPKDEKTCRLLNQGKTDGVFQSESAGFTNLLNRLKVEGDNECIVANALYRPGTLDSGITDEYILRRAGKKPITYPAPELEKAFKETYGLPIYQEEIMQGAQVLCGYSLGQADNVRRIIGRKIKEEMGPCIADMKEAAKKIGTPEEAVEKFASVVEASASYLFNHCLSGDTVITRNSNKHGLVLTIAEMYKIRTDREYAKSTGHRSLHDKYMKYGYGKSFSLCDKNTRIKENDIINIYYSGKNKIYRLKTSSGKYVDCTMLHKIPTTNGTKYLKDIKIGDEVYVKGERFVPKYDYRLYQDVPFAPNTPHKGQCGFRENPNGRSRILEEKRERCVEQKLPCEICGTPYDKDKKFEIHHADKNRCNNSDENLDGIVVSNSHAAAYGITAWRSAYLKAHYPIEFMASFLNQKCKDKDFPAYVKATKDMGITILPPELGADMCQKRGTGIQLGTNCIKGVGSLEPPINKNSLAEIINQYPSNKLEALIKGGALDYLKVPRSKMIGSIKSVKQYYAIQKSALEAIQRWKVNTKFKPENIEKKIKHYEEVIKNNVIEWHDDTSFDDIDGELKVFGFSFQDPLKHYDLSLVNNKTTFAGYVSKFKKLHDRNGNPMAFIDLDNGLSFAMFHKQYQELKEGKPYLIGAYQGSRGMIINSVRPLRRLDN